MGRIVYYIIKVVQPPHKQHQLLQFHHLTGLSNQQILLLTLLVIEGVCHGSSTQVGGSVSLALFNKHPHVLWSQPHVLLVYAAVEVQVDRKHLVDIVHVGHLVLSILRKGRRLQLLNARKRVRGGLDDFKLRSEVDQHFLIVHLGKVWFQFEVVKNNGESLYYHEMDFPVVRTMSMHYGVVKLLCVECLEGSGCTNENFESLVLDQCFERHSQLPVGSQVTSSQHCICSFTVCKKLLIESFVSEFENEIVVVILVIIFQLYWGETQLIYELPHCFFCPRSEPAYLFEQCQLSLRPFSLPVDPAKFAVVVVEEQLIRLLHTLLILFFLVELLPFEQVFFVFSSTAQLLCLVERCDFFVDFVCLFPLLFFFEFHEFQPSLLFLFDFLEPGFLCLFFLVGEGDDVVGEVESPLLLALSRLIYYDFLQSFGELKNPVFGQCDGKEIAFVLPARWKSKLRYVCQLDSCLGHYILQFVEIQVLELLYFGEIVKGIVVNGHYALGRTNFGVVYFETLARLAVKTNLQLVNQRLVLVHSNNQNYIQTHQINS